MMTKLEGALARARMRRRLPPPELRRHLRKRSGLSQRAVAEAIGVDRSQVARWEIGERDPRPGPNLERYLQVLDRLVKEGSI